MYISDQQPTFWSVWSRLGRSSSKKLLPLSVLWQKKLAGGKINSALDFFVRMEDTILDQLMGLGNLGSCTILRRPLTISLLRVLGEEVLWFMLRWDGMSRQMMDSSARRAELTTSNTLERHADSHRSINRPHGNSALPFWAAVLIRFYLLKTDCPILKMHSCCVHNFSQLRMNRNFILRSS